MTTKFHYRESPNQKQKDKFKKYLSEDEELILVTGLSAAYMRNKFIMYILFPGLLFLGLGLGLGWFLELSKIASLVLAFIAMFFASILKTIHTRHSTKYLLTTRRVIIKK